MRMSSPRIASLSTVGSEKSPNKTLSACLNCRKKKVKCSGSYPCRYCSKRGLGCSFPGSEQRRLYSIAKIRELEEKLASYESQSQTTKKGKAGQYEVDDAQPESQERADVPPSPPGLVEFSTQQTQLWGDSLQGGLFTSPVLSTAATRDFTSPQGANEASPSQRIVVDPDTSWSQNFGYRVQTLLEEQGTQYAQPSPSLHKSTRELLFPRSRPPLRLRRVQDETSPALPDLPNEAEAYQLLETVIFYLGHAQHFFDTRDFSDRLAAFYTYPRDIDQTSSIWYLQILLILAIGKLLRGELDGNSELPGFTWFSHAMELLPNLSEVRAHGVAGIEVLALVAVYFQNIDRKEDAAIYISTALRLALSHNLHRKSTLQQLFRSEETHVNRLWWTVYMHDRRLSIATGGPLSIDHTSIDISPPTDSPGYASPLAIQINIQIAQIQGKIYSVIYSHEPHPEGSFFASVQDIIQALTRIAKQMPDQTSFNTALPRQGISDIAIRTRISLDTMLYQTIILALRPVLLHHAKLILDQDATFDKSSNPFEQLTRACVEAARRSLELMIILQKKDMIAPFGFFDLDTIFSASFIMLLTPIIDSTNDDRSHATMKLSPSPDIKEALQLLDYLVGFQNTAAMTRRSQIQRLRERISSLIEPLSSTTSASGHVLPAETDGNGEHGVLGASPPTMSASHGISALDPWNPVGADLLTSCQGERDAGSGNGDNLNTGFSAGALPIQFPENHHDMYTLYYDEGFSLVGADLGGFEELERHVFNFGM